jgi:putative acyl-CoA dehydrogenase
VPQADGTYLLTGHKWFCSAPMSDVFLVLAQAPDGITCFVVPRVLDDGTRNPIRIQRLKDKLGNRANASSEVEYDGVVGWRLGDEGRGVRTIVEMVSATRLDCVLGSAALMRASVAEAQWHTRHRQAFGKPLVEQPLMHAVLADLEVETQAATVLGMRLAAAVDADDESQRRLRRIALPASKFLVTKRSMAVTGEALECLGGNGYAEESGMPRLYREAPVNSVWEGSGNVNALDLLRAITREDGVIEALADELATVRGADAVLDAAADETIAALRSAQASPDEAAARGLAERAATTLQAALLVRYAAPAVADAFVATRVVTRHAAFGADPRPLAAVPLP